MFQLFRSLSSQSLVLRQVPAFLLAFLIAGTLYRFHSFHLETGAFLVTWFVIDAVIEVAVRARAAVTPGGPSPM